MHSTLPKTLNGPQRNVAGKTIDSVRLVESSLSRLCETIKDYHYSRTNLLKCVTLDMKHFHATTHYKNDVMSMLQYCRSFGNYCQGECKESFSMECSLLYTDFTHPSSWYALPEGTVQFCEVPILKPLPAREISPFNTQRRIARLRKRL